LVYSDLQLTEEEIDNLTLLEIEKYLQANRKSLEDFPIMPFPEGYVTENLGNRLIYDEKNYNVAQQLLEFNRLFASLTGSKSSSFLTLLLIFLSLYQFLYFIYLIYFR
jgi:hypothetical protein